MLHILEMSLFLMYFVLIRYYLREKKKKEKIDNPSLISPFPNLLAPLFCPFREMRQRAGLAFNNVKTK